MIDAYMVAAAIAVRVTFAAIGAAIGTAAVCWLAWTTLRDSWRRARAVIEETQDELGDEPVPYWPSEEPDEKTVSRLGAILFCPVCHPGGHGRCTCVAYCGDRQCTYGHTMRLSAEEAAWLRGLGITEGTGQ